MQQFIRPPRIRGNSGCTVELVSSPVPTIRKIAHLEYDTSRLHEQRVKQEAFHTTVPGIVVPRVLSWDGNSFTMEYLPMLDVLQFFEQAQPKAIHEHFDILLNFVEEEFSLATTGPVQQELFQWKLESIRMQLHAPYGQAFYRFAFDSVEKYLTHQILLPLGPCHGDLTLSNVLFAINENSIALIDFLDSFIDSPIIDLIKLRQDTRFKWTSRLCPEIHDIAKANLISAELDEALVQRFHPQINSAEFLVLDILNYLRIAPYCNSFEDHTYLANVLHTIIEKGES